MSVADVVFWVGVGMSSAVLAEFVGLPLGAVLRAFRGGIR